MAKKLSLSLLTAILIFFTTALPAHANTARWSGVCVNDQGVATIQGLECLIGNIFTVIITVLGVAGFVMFIIASFRWLISGGNTKGTEMARNTMTFAVVGIVLALSSFIILQLLASFTGIDSLLEFRVPTSSDQLVGE